MRCATPSPIPRTEVSPSRPRVGGRRATTPLSRSHSKVAPTPDTSTWGGRTVTPWRRASATSDWGDQNPMGWELSSPAQNAAG